MLQRVMNGFIMQEQRISAVPEGVCVYRSWSAHNRVKQKCLKCYEPVHLPQWLTLYTVFASTNNQPARLKVAASAQAAVTFIASRGRLHPSFSCIYRRPEPILKIFTCFVHLSLLQCWALELGSKVRTFSWICKWKLDWISVLMQKKKKILTTRLDTDLLQSNVMNLL